MPPRVCGNCKNWQEGKCSKFAGHYLLAFVCAGNDEIELDKSLDRIAEKLMEDYNGNTSLSFL